MIRVVPYRPQHLYLLRPQEQQVSALEGMPPEHAVMLSNSPSASVMLGDEVLLCGGVVPIWEGRSMVWAYVSRDIGPHLLAVTRGTREFLYEHATRRMEMYVECSFQNGHRWARLLGFAIEQHYARGFFPDGSAASVYVRLH